MDTLPSNDFNEEPYFKWVVGFPEPGSPIVSDSFTCMRVKRRLKLTTHPNPYKTHWVSLYIISEDDDFQAHEITVFIEAPSKLLLPKGIQNTHFNRDPSELETLSEDTGKLLDDPTDHNAVIECQGEFFYVHSEILESRWRQIAELLSRANPSSAIEMTVYLETPNELKFSSRASIKDPVSCIRTYRKEEIDMVLQRGWQSIPFVFVLEAVELKLSSREYDIKVYSPDSSDVETFLNDIGKLQSNANNCNIFVDVDGERFPAHKEILCARAKKFEEKCQGLVRQTPSVIKIDGVDKEIFREILHYIYKGKLSRNLQTPGFAERLYRAARILGLDQLANKCSNWFLVSDSRKCVRCAYSGRQRERRRVKRNSHLLSI